MKVVIIRKKNSRHFTTKFFFIERHEKPDFCTKLNKHTHIPEHETHTHTHTHTCTLNTHTRTNWSWSKTELLNFFLLRQLHLSHKFHSCLISSNFDFEFPELLLFLKPWFYFVVERARDYMLCFELKLWWAFCQYFCHTQNLEKPIVTQNLNSRPFFADIPLFSAKATRTNINDVVCFAFLTHKLWFCVIWLVAMETCMDILYSMTLTYSLTLTPKKQKTN